jgi:hypothetical protein
LNYVRSVDSSNGLEGQIKAPQPSGRKVLDAYAKENQPSKVIDMDTLEVSDYRAKVEKNFYQLIKSHYQIEYYVLLQEQKNQVICQQVNSQTHLVILFHQIYMM